LDVDPQRQRFRCWSCGQAGDIFDFIMLRERVGFREALESLAARAGIELPAGRRGAEAASQRARMLELLRWAERRYQEWLLNRPAAESARNYLASRSLRDETVRRFALGFAPHEWSALVDAAGRNGWEPQLLERCGLARRRSSGSGYYDLFRGRLMFPIHDGRGRTIGFGARVLPGPGSEGQPKYINTPETPLFRKGMHLYGMDLAREAILRRREAVVVEGYTDCIMAHQHGVCHVVGTLGTALGSAHVSELRRLADRIVLVFDGDEAGQRSADRALGLFLSEAVDLRVLVLPGGLDPCEFITQYGAERFQAEVARAADPFEFKLAWVERQVDVSTVAGVREAVDAVLATVAALPPLPAGNVAVTRENVLARLAHRYGLSDRSIQKRLQELRAQQKPAGTVLRPNGPERSGPAGAEQRLERELLEIVLAEPDTLPQAGRRVRPEEFTSELYRRIYQLALSAAERGESPLDAIRLQLDDPQAASMVSALAIAGETKGNVDRRLNDVLDAFELRRAERAEAALQQRWSRAADSDEQIKQLLAEKYRSNLERQRKGRPVTP